MGLVEDSVKGFLVWLTRDFWCLIIERQNFAGCLLGDQMIDCVFLVRARAPKRCPLECGRWVGPEL